MWCEAPKATELASLLSGLFGRNTTVKELPPQRVAPSGLVTVFVKPDKAPAAVAVSDFPFAASAGAVLTLLPANVVKDAVAKKTIEGTMAENLGEVLNVLSSKLTRSPNRVIMRLPFTVATAAPDDAKPIVTKPGKRVDYEIDIAGYGAGRVAFFLA